MSKGSRYTDEQIRAAYATAVRFLTLGQNVGEAIKALRAADTGGGPDSDLSTALDIMFRHAAKSSGLPVDDILSALRSPPRKAGKRRASDPTALSDGMAFAGAMSPGVVVPFVRKGRLAGGAR